MPMPSVNPLNVIRLVPANGQVNLHPLSHGSIRVFS